MHRHIRTRTIKTRMANVVPPQFTAMLIFHLIQRGCRSIVLRSQRSTPGPPEDTPSQQDKSRQQIWRCVAIPQDGFRLLPRYLHESLTGLRFLSSGAVQPPNA